MLIDCILDRYDNERDNGFDNYNPLYMVKTYPRIFADNDGEPYNETVVKANLRDYIYAEYNPIIAEYVDTRTWTKPVKHVSTAVIDIMAEPVPGMDLFDHGMDEINAWHLVKHYMRAAKNTAVGNSAVLERYAKKWFDIACEPFTAED